MADRIKIVFTHVTVLKDADWIGSGDFYFIATVDRRPVGTRDVLLTEHGRRFKLPQPQWSAEVDVTAKSSVRIKFECKDEDTFVDDDLGSVSYILRTPWTQGTHRLSN